MNPANKMIVVYLSERGRERMLCIIYYTYIARSIRMFACSSALPLACSPVRSFRLFAMRQILLCPSRQKLHIFLCFYAIFCRERRSKKKRTNKPATMRRKSHFLFERAKHDKIKQNSVLNEWQTEKSGKNE